MGLNAKQKQAVEYLAGPLLVLAGPGTGKTQLLSHKVAYILENTDTNPENILCLTFTEVAAANMRERLKSIIGKESMKVNIGTYHAFGADILAQYKNYAVDYDRDIDAAIDEVMQFKIVKKIMRELSGRDLLRKDKVKDVIQVISAAKSAGLSSADLTKIAEQNLADSKVISETISPFLKEVVPRAFGPSYKNAYLPIWEILKEYTEMGTIVGTVEHSIGELARDLKSAITEAEENEKITPLSHWKDAYFEKDGRGKYRLKDRVANRKLSSVAKVMAKYNKYLQENGLYDFDDMIQEAVRVLKEDDGFRATLSEHYQFIMLDEFQDTNPAQFMIIKQLTDYEKPMIMAVGDDDQAIYEFQGALSTNLTDFQKHYTAEVIPLVENYRSTGEILDFSRKIINQAPDRFADKELIAHRPDPETSQIHRYEFLSSDMEFGFIADKIAELIRAGEKQSEIAIISYKTRYFMPLLPYLKAKPQINIAYAKKNDLFEDEKIHQILTIAQYVYELANERNENTSIVEILSYPFWRLPVLEVVRLVGTARHAKKSVFDYISASENSEITEVAKFLANLAGRSFNEPLERWLNFLIGAEELEGFRSPFLEYCADEGEYEKFTLYENLAALLGKLKRHFGEKNLRLNDLIELVNDYKEAEMTLDTTSPYRDADDAVQILSAHKAKGLEFKHVFIISTDHTAWGKGKGNNNGLSLPKNLAKIRHTGMTDGERLRILYVALTRAKEFLYITNSLRDFRDKSPDRLEYFDEYVAEDQVVSPFLPTGKVETMYDFKRDDDSIANLRNWLSPYTKLMPDLRALYKDRVAKWRMSASSLTTFIDIVYAGPQEFFKKHILQTPMEVEDENLALGNLVHATFEAVTTRGLTENAAAEFFLTELEKKDLPAETAQKIREKGLADLAVALKEFSPIIRQGQAEVNFAPEKLAVEGVPLTGKIDHITIDEKAKEIEIYDFKTGSYKKEKWQSNEKLLKYMFQLGFYKLLLNNSPRFRNYKVKKGHILFVTPDSDGQVYDRMYEFNTEDETALIELMRAVYAQVTSLKFVDDPEVFVAADKDKGLKEIKEFIALLLAKNT